MKTTRHKGLVKYTSKRCQIQEFKGLKMGEEDGEKIKMIITREKEGQKA